MAKEETKDVKKSKEETGKKGEGKLGKLWSGAKRVALSRKTHVTLGVLIIVFSVYLGIAMLSYFFTGESDSSLIENEGEVATYAVGSELAGSELYGDGEMEQGITNWGGETGARLSDWFINKQFGIASFFLLGVFVLIGLKLIRGKSQPFWKIATMLMILLIWFSLFVSFCFGTLYEDGFIKWGGENGMLMKDKLNGMVGGIGTFLILLASAILFFVFFKESAIPFIGRRMMGLKDSFVSMFRRGEKEVLEEDGKKEGGEEEINSETMTEEVIQEKKEEEENGIEEPIEEPNDEQRNEDGDSDEDDWIIPITEDDENGETEEHPADGTDDIQMDIEVPEDDIAENVESGASVKDSDRLLAEMGEYDPTLDLAHYEFPTFDLLRDYDSGAPAVDVEEQNANKERIIKILRDFNIEINGIKAIVGPTVTLYEIELQAGIRVSRVRGLQDDIMMGLAAKGIRMMCPIPGKQAIGIEVPNAKPQTVSMQSVLNSKKFKEAQEKYKLPVAIGKTITNEVFTFDLAKTPHVLVAGATGQGKSVGLNAIITSLLYSVHPSRLKFVMVDPKKVEFTLYSRMERQFLTKIPSEDEPIITDVKRVVQTLNSLTKEMDSRYDLLKKASVRNIVEYNEKFCKRQLNPEKGHRFLPYIVVIVDEFGDLIMTAGKEVEMPIARIAQLARAVGMHMILATQRPSVNIITGVIKANFPTRIAFRVSSVVDSRTILDEKGAEGLIGRGDMLFSKDSETTRVQCAFVDTPEVENIVDFIGEQQGFASPFLLPECDADAGNNIGSGNFGGGDFGGGGGDGQRDPLFEEVARSIVKSRQGSTSNIQRQYQIGYNRAGRIMDQLEEAGIVGPQNGSKPRDILIQTEYDLENLLHP